MNETIDDPITASLVARSGEDWLLPGAIRDRQTITAQWDPADQQLIDGVQVRQVVNVPKQNGYLTEMFRTDWDIGPPVDQVFQVMLVAGGISAWHAHESTFDRLFVASGVVRVVLYDSRSNSPTHGVINDFRFGAVRPALVLVPPRVWHGVMNIGGTPAALMNMPDRAYHYEHPDHWRLPGDSPEIPFRF
jgi:dTDP-4-dehydrorhamnose 3,5-epimerase